MRNLVDALAAGESVDLDLWKDAQEDAAGKIGLAVLVHLRSWAAIEVSA